MIKLNICCLVLIIGSVEVGPDIDMKFHQEVMEIVSYDMYTSEKTDRVIWQVTKTTGVPILGRTQEKHMNYISYQEIHAPKD